MRRREFNTRFCVILLLIGICLKLQAVDSLFVRENSEKYQIQVLAEGNYEQMDFSYTNRNQLGQRKLLERVILRQDIYAEEIDFCLECLNVSSVNIINEVFQEQRNDLKIVDFIHHQDGKKDEIAYT